MMFNFFNLHIYPRTTEVKFGDFVPGKFIYEAGELNSKPMHAKIQDDAMHKEFKVNVEVQGCRGREEKKESERKADI